MKKLIALLLAVVMVLGLVACSNGSSSSTTTTESTGTTTETPDASGSSETPATDGNVQKTLTIGTAQDINSLDLQMQNDQINNNCLALTHQTLVQLTNDAADTGITYVPELATSWEWEDDNTLVFHLVEGATFSDGSPLTADDCVFTYEMAIQPDTYVSSTLSLITGVEARDDVTFVIHTSSYSNEILSNISGKPMGIQSRAAYDSGMDQPYLIGSGQYVFKEWKEG